jgi:hypothetical protein
MNWQMGMQAAKTRALVAAGFTNLNSSGAATLGVRATGLLALCAPKTGCDYIVFVADGRFHLEAMIASKRSLRTGADLWRLSVCALHACACAQCLCMRSQCMCCCFAAWKLSLFVCYITQHMSFEPAPLPYTHTGWLLWPAQRDRSKLSTPPSLMNS